MSLDMPYLYWPCPPNPSFARITTASPLMMQNVADQTRAKIGKLLVDLRQKASSGQFLEALPSFLTWQAHHTELAIMCKADTDMLSAVPFPRYDSSTHR